MRSQVLRIGNNITIPGRTHHDELLCGELVLAVTALAPQSAGNRVYANHARCPLLSVAILAASVGRPAPKPAPVRSAGLAITHGRLLELYVA